MKDVIEKSKKTVSKLLETHRELLDQNPDNLHVRKMCNNLQIFMEAVAEYEENEVNNV